MRSKSNTLPGVLLAIISALGILFSLATIGFLTVDFLYLKTTPEIRGMFQFGFPSLSIVFLATAALFVHICTLIVSISYLQNKPAKELRSHSVWQLTGLLLAWIAVIAMGYFIVQEPDGGIWLALLTPPAIIIPICIFVNLARIGLPRSTRLWETGTVTLGLTISPLIIIAAEIIIIVAIAVAVIFFLDVQGDFARIFPSVYRNFTNPRTRIESFETLFFNFMQQPLVAAAAFLSLGVVAPLIEEIVKPLVLWLLLDRGLRDTDGYALGLISGGTFALLESAGMVLQLDAQFWMPGVIMRAITGVLHIGLSGMVGFGLVRSKTINRPAIGFITLLSAVGLHGVWNSLALYSGLATFSPLGTLGVNELALSAIVSILIMVAVFVTVVLINFFIRRFLSCELTNSKTTSSKI